MEIWKNIEGFDYYQVSNHGRVKSLTRTHQRQNPKHKQFKQTITVGKEKIINGWDRKGKNGKLVKVCVALRKDGKTYVHAVHTLVLSAFVGSRPDGMECCHNDGNPKNNNLENLRWDTHKENMADCMQHGRKTNPPLHYGDAHPNSKLNDKMVSDIRLIPYYHGLFANISREYGISSAHASRIWNGEGWN